MRTLIIAEAGVNHNGNLEQAKSLCLAAQRSGADVVKFQTWKTENIITKTVSMADYQKTNTGIVQSQFEMLKSLELSYEDFFSIKKYCDEIDIQFASTADDEESLDFIISLGVPFIKVGSGDIGNISYLRYIGSKKLPVILSTGMSTLSDVERSVFALKEGGVEDITLLHCTTNYPCPYNEVNLRSMLTLKHAFGLPVGYSDHTIGTEIPISAVALGACVIEKHFTIDRNMSGPDHLASTEPKLFKIMVDSIRNVEVALGSGLKGPSVSEGNIAKVVKKRIVAKHEIPYGKIIDENDVCVKRNNTGLPADAWNLVIGIKARKNYVQDEGIEF